MIEILISALVILGIGWLFDFNRYLVMPIIVVAILIIIGYFIGIGVRLAGAADTKADLTILSKKCEQIGQFVCTDILKTYESNSYNNIAIIQRAGVLVTLYHEMGCPADVLATCVIDNLIEEK